MLAYFIIDYFMLDSRLNSKGSTFFNLPLAKMFCYFLDLSNLKKPNNVKAYHINQNIKKYITEFFVFCSSDCGFKGQIWSIVIKV